MQSKQNEKAVLVDTTLLENEAPNGVYETTLSPNGDRKVQEAQEISSKLYIESALKPINNPQTFNIPIKNKVPYPGPESSMIPINPQRRPIFTSPVRFYSKTPRRIFYPNQLNPQQLTVRRQVYASPQRRKRPPIYKFNIDERLNGSSNMLDEAQSRRVGFLRNYGMNNNRGSPQNYSRNKRIYSSRNQIKNYGQSRIPAGDDFEEEVKIIVG